MAADRAVLLCPAIGWEGLRTHQAMRLLGERCAASGLPTLRLAYPGTADSLDLAADAEPWTAWLDSVAAAADWLRDVSGARRLVLGGLRIGATLAMLAAQRRDDVSALLLLAPVLRGRSFLQQLRLQAELETGIRLPPGRLDYLELSFGATTLEAIGAVDLRGCRFGPDQAVGVFAQSPGAALGSCIAAWRDGGATVQTPPFEGLEPLSRIDLWDTSPAPDFVHVMQWLDDRAPAAPDPTRSRQGLSPGRLVARPQGNAREAAFRETPARFGSGGRLFGMLCEPVNGARDLVMVILNTGRDPHYGISRFGVDLARHLAECGIASMRIDFAGLGDSLAAPAITGQPSTLFDEDRSCDVTAAIDWLDAAGFHRFAVHGLCSGAYHGFVAARADRRVGAMVLLNTPVFDRTPGEDTAALVVRQTTSARLLGNLRRREFYRRLVRGEVELARVARAQLLRLLRRTFRRPRSLADTGISAWSGMRALGARGVRTLLLYAQDDPGLTMLEESFGRGGRRLRMVPGVSIEVMAGIDHILSGREMRRRAIGRIAAFLSNSGDTVNGATR